MAQNTSNNVVLFGGSSGIGLAVAKLALTHLPKPSVIICSSNAGKLEKAIEEIKAVELESAIIDSVVADLGNIDTQFDDVEAVLKAAKSKFNGPIDHIVWTAGDVTTGGFKQRTNDDLVAFQAVRLFGPLTLGALAKDYMTVSRHSSITITSGIRVYKPAPGRGRLTAAAGGLESGARSLAVDLAPIRVNAIVLGAFHTPLLNGVAPPGSERAKAFAEGTLCKTIGLPDEAAEAYLYSMRCAYVTGSQINCEGGALLC